MSASSSELVNVGWREWAKLPDLNIPAIKVKIDTGARTSALHAVNIERKQKNGSDIVVFDVQPLQRNDNVLVRAEAPLVDVRAVSDSGGHSEERYVVRSRILIGDMDKEIDITLTERYSMMFRMLVGRTALAEQVLVNPSKSFVCGRMSAKKLYSSQVETQS